MWYMAEKSDDTSIMMALDVNVMLFYDFVVNFSSYDGGKNQDIKIKKS